MAEKALSISAAKARFLAVADEVATSGRSVVVTKRGRPFVRVVPFEAPRPLIGSVRYHVDEEEFVHGGVGSWDVEAG
ncbi:MAG TPA: type II toxin-antitoxin system Phd/YefM family antitoxin [Miltoncostaeaceae bacterium]|nr:type II toxin-antitoxin system Phd/YefM family antitoxin [Miltoncostaeaceae bacterium]